MAKGRIRRYIWLIDTIRSANGITYEEINRKWNRSALNDGSRDWSKRTFFQNINDIRDEFGIEITCDRRDNKYYIEEELSEYGSIRRSLVDALVLNNAITEMPAMKSRILLSRRFSHENLGIITHAVQQNSVIQFRHLYKDGEGKILTDDVLEFEPFDNLMKKQSNSAGGLVEIPYKMPVWVEPITKDGATDMKGAFEMAKAIIKKAGANLVFPSEVQEGRSDEARFIFNISPAECLRHTQLPPPRMVFR